MLQNTSYVSGFAEGKQLLEKLQDQDLCTNKALSPQMAIKCSDLDQTQMLMSSKTVTVAGFSSYKASCTAFTVSSGLVTSDRPTD